VLDASEFEAEALKIAGTGSKENITLRLLGALAIRIHCPKYNYLHAGLNRSYTDVDLIAYRKQHEKILRLLKGLGYSYDFRILAVYGANRLILENDTSHLKVDVFFDKLEFCHTIDFAKNGRLEVDYPTISVSDLLLEKMQIVDITEKDLIDTSILLLEHEIGNTDNNMFNMDYLVKLLSQDWGFYYTVTTNLTKVKNSIEPNTKIPNTERTAAIGKIDRLLESLEKTPKSTAWKIRARVGTSKKWYRSVEEVIR
jgi:hypothetical protein